MNDHSSVKDWEIPLASQGFSVATLVPSRDGCMLHAETRPAATQLLQTKPQVAPIHLPGKKPTQRRTPTGRSTRRVKLVTHWVTTNGWLLTKILSISFLCCVNSLPTHPKLPGHCGTPTKTTRKLQRSQKNKTAPASPIPVTSITSKRLLVSTKCCWTRRSAAASVAAACSSCSCSLK